MRYLFILFVFCCVTGSGQQSDGLAAELRAIHQKVSASGCTGGEGLLVSNRAMYLVLSDKIGSYLSRYSDLSFYKNNITFDALDGTFSLNHNLFQPTGRDKPIRSFFVVGGRANVVNALVSAFSSRGFQNEMAITVQHNWLSAPKARFSCAQKGAMDASRALLVEQLISNYTQQWTRLQEALSRLRDENVPGQGLEVVKDSLRRKFEQEKKTDYLRQLAKREAEQILQEHPYTRLSLSRTAISIYLPVIGRQALVTASLQVPLQSRGAYPFEMEITHTHLIDWGKKGRLFFTLTGELFLNNNIRSKALPELSVAYYRQLGGTDHSILSRANEERFYLGRYRNFLTPAISSDLVFFPPDSHIGVSASIGKNLGEDKALRVSLGLPVVLIDKDTNPAANFHFLLVYRDHPGTAFSAKTWKEKISVGLQLGVPFSKIIY